MTRPEPSALPSNRARIALLWRDIASVAATSDGQIRGAWSRCHGRFGYGMGTGDGEGGIGAINEMPLMTLARVDDCCELIAVA